MLRIRTIIRPLIGATVVAGSMAILAPAAQARSRNQITNVRKVASLLVTGSKEAYEKQVISFRLPSTPVACSENALVDAINLANNTVAKDTLALAGNCTYAMTAPHGGPTNALPVITTPIELLGPATITRVSLLLLFRIAEVSSTGSLTLTTSVALTNGSVLGDGGGILNRGAVTLTVSRLSGNHATGNGGGMANADTPSGTAPAASFTGSAVSGNSTVLSGGGIYNGQRGTLSTTGVPMDISGNTAVVNGGGIAAVNSTATTLTGTTVTNNVGVLGGGVYRQGAGTMTTTNSPISANLVNNCVGSNPAVPNCTG